MRESAGVDPRMSPYKCLGFRYSWGFPKIRGTLFESPNNKDCNILGSILGSPYFGKLPFIRAPMFSPRLRLSSSKYWGRHRAANGPLADRLLVFRYEGLSRFV